MSGFLSTVLAADVNSGVPLEVSVDNSSHLTELQVYIMDEAQLNIDVPLYYIRSGEKEIQNYVNNVSKPEINRYIINYAEPIVAKVVNEQAETLVSSYVEDVTKPSIDAYVGTEIEPKLQEYVDAASGSATAAAGFVNDAGIAAAAAEISAAAATDTLAQVGVAVDAGIAQFDANAVTKQALVDAAADAAAASALAAQGAKDEAQIQAFRAQTEATRSEGYANSINPQNFVNIALDNIPYTILMPTSGEVVLVSGKSYSHNVSGNVNYILPEPNSGMVNEIEVVVNMASAYTVNVATDVFVNDTAPDLSKAGSYTLIWFYDWNKSVWVCGGFVNGKQV